MNDLYFLSLCFSVDVIAAPSPVDTFGCIPESQTSLFLRWTQPERTYVINPLLVSYTLYYSTDRILNYTSSPSVTDLRVDSEGVGTYVLDGLQPGTRYYLGMRAENRAGTSAQASVTQVATTFGNGSLPCFDSTCTLIYSLHVHFYITFTSVHDYVYVYINLYFIIMHIKYVQCC